MRNNRGRGYPGHSGRFARTTMPSWKWIEFLSAPQNLLLLTQGTPESPTTLLPTRTSLLEDPATFANNPIMEAVRRSRWSAA